MKTLIPLLRAGRLGDLPTLLDTVPGLSAEDAEELAHGLTLVTSDVREFERVPGLPTTLSNPES